MTTPPYDGCLWPLDLGVNDDAWAADFDASTQLRAQALASNTLRRLTAFRVGGCPIKTRPCSGGYTGNFMRMSAFVNGVPYGEPFLPLNWNGSWYNTCSCLGPCGCTSGKGITLPHPVCSVSEVKLNGAVLTKDVDYWVSRNVVYPLGATVFPLTQDLSLPDTQPGTLSVTYYDSWPVDGMGAAAAGLLAFEYAKAQKTGKCSLPATVTQVVRQGVSYTLPSGAFPNGETGIREVDAFIALWNPGHRRQRTKVWVPR